MKEFKQMIKICLQENNFFFWNQSCAIHTSRRKSLKYPLSHHLTPLTHPAQTLKGQRLSLPRSSFSHGREGRLRDGTHGPRTWLAWNNWRAVVEVDSPMGPSLSCADSVRSNQHHGEKRRPPPTPRTTPPPSHSYLPVWPHVDFGVQGFLFCSKQGYCSQ